MITNINARRLNALLENYAPNATLDDAQDALEWLVHGLDFAGLEERLETVLARLSARTGTPLYIRSREQREKCPAACDDQGCPAHYAIQQTPPLFASIFKEFDSRMANGQSHPKQTLGSYLNATLKMNGRGYINITNGEKFGTPHAVWYGKIKPAGVRTSPMLEFRANLPIDMQKRIASLVRDYDTFLTLATREGA